MKYIEIAVAYESESFADFMQLVRKPEISIEFPPNGELARKVISRSNAKATGKLPSWKMGRSLHYESKHERNAFKLLNACPQVSAILEQPCIIRYVMNGENHIHYPDILVKLPTGNELLEVKTAEDASSVEVSERTKFMTQALPHLGYSYRILEAEQLAKLPRLTTVETILKFGRSPVSFQRREQIRQLFKSNISICWGAFKPGMPLEKYRNNICRLILEGTLRIDFNNPYTDSSVIHSVGNCNGDTSW
jgi:hypothetical protein